MLRPICILFILMIWNGLYSQNLSTSNPGNLTAARVEQSDSGIYLIGHSRSGCKNFSEESYFIPGPTIALQRSIRKANDLQPRKFISIHGNVQYNFNYRSYIDTPFAESDMMQHSVQTTLHVTLKDRYPFTVYLTSRRSNSSYFNNATDVSFQFRQAEMLEDIKRKMRLEAEGLQSEKALLLTPAQIYQQQKDGVLKDPGNFSAIAKNAAGKIVSEKQQALQEKFQKLYGDYKTKMDKLSALQAWTRRSSTSQDIVEEKERQLRGDAVDGKDSLMSDAVAAGQKFYLAKTQQPDSTVKAAKASLEDNRKEIDSLRSSIAQTEKELKTFQKKTTDSLQQLRKQISSITDRNSLYAYLQKTGQPGKTISGLQKALLSVKQVGLGRTWIDYSELTVKNISLNGINVEANPGNVYVAAAAGKVNYRFRDYIVKGTYAGSNQSVALVRAGFGKKDKSNIIITYYSGKKALLNQRTIADSAAVQLISGLSVESRVALDANNCLVGEYARSSSPVLKGKIMDLKDHTNEAWSLKLFSHYGNTKVTSYYRKTGENFQSFTLFPTNNRQDAWMVKANQSVWKKQLIFDAAIRKNDFNSPIALPDFSNKNVFRSFQITERIAKLPFASVGYYPSSQLTLSNNNVLYENRYNTLNAMVSHSYFLDKLSMSSSATYTKFYNSGIDSGFIYYNASTFTINHSLNFSHVVLQGIFTLTDQSQLHQVAIEPGITYQLRNRLSVSGSVKWSRVNHTKTLWGGTAGLNLYVNKAGMLQLQYDKIYLPGYNRNLLPVDIGRLTFSREF